MHSFFSHSFCLCFSLAFVCGLTIFWLFQLQELKANPHRNAKGIVIEAGLDKAKGPFATFIVQKGTLRKGDVVVCGEAFGKVYPKFSFLLKLHCQMV